MYRPADSQMEKIDMHSIFGVYKGWIVKFIRAISMTLSILLDTLLAKSWNSQSAG